MTDKLKFKVVPFKPPKKVPAEAKPLTVQQIADQMLTGINRLEQMVLNFNKDLMNLRSGLDYTEARLNRVVRLTKTLAIKAGVPD